ncbi:MAG: helix-turn-helix domain-containing protein [Bdellovibrionaceae bacterium]|jgi:predicted DNA-binding mobile mystery protein A|nr:helix-turn-helix domain-containing protein [Pseudobdellovibrionaceae bacterium]
MNIYQGLKLAQVDRKIRELKGFKEASQVSDGWVRLIRKILGMSLNTLSDKLGIDQSTLTRLENREANKKITLEKLEEVANTLDCDLVYALVPKTTFKEKIESQATFKAKKLLEKAGVHMELENQSVLMPYSERVNILKEKLIKNGDIW